MAEHPRGYLESNGAAGEPYEGFPSTRTSSLDGLYPDGRAVPIIRDDAWALPA